MKNRIAHLLEAPKEKSIEQLASEKIAEMKQLRHRRLMTVRFMDASLAITAEAVLTQDQHKRYWLNKTRPMTAPEVVAWYGDALFGSVAVETDHDDERGLQQLFRLAAKNGGAK